MDFDLTAEQEAFRRSVQAFLKDEASSRKLREWERTPAGFDPNVYRRFSDLGWLGISVPESAGGGGASFVEEVVLYEELGRTLLPGPHYTAVQCAHLLEAFVPEDRRRVSIDPILSGERVVALALGEEEAGDDLDFLATTATPADGGYGLSGEKNAVEFGHVADQLLVVARTGNPDSPVALLLIDREAPGVLIERRESIGGEPRGRVALRDVRVAADHAFVVGAGEAGQISTILGRLKLLRAAELLGIAAAALNLAVEYSKERVQYGRPIGAFQAIEHKLATILTRLELARWPVYHAAWQLAEGLPDNGQVARALVQCGKMARNATSEAIQTHGGLGVMDDSEVSVYFRRAKARQLELGYQDELLEQVAVAVGLR